MDSSIAFVTGLFLGLLVALSIHITWRTKWESAQWENLTMRIDAPTGAPVTANPGRIQSSTLVATLEHLDPELDEDGFPYPETDPLLDAILAHGVDEDRGWNVGKAPEPTTGYDGTEEGHGGYSPF